MEREKKTQSVGQAGQVCLKRRGAGVHVLYRAEAREMSRLLIHRV